MFTRSNQRQKLFNGLLALILLAGMMVLLSDAPDIHAANRWQAKYWNNKNLAGDPVLVRQEDNLDHDWGDGAPPEVDKDAFSARWKRTINVSGGTYRFTATMDDGMRVWVDGTLIIDSWWDSQVHSMTADVYLGAGDHTVKVEYYEAGGKAVARLSWTQVNAPGAIVNWRGEYYNNVSLSGSPVLVRDDQGLSFDWGGGSPAWGVVSADQFSVRWTRDVYFENGRYRFRVTADDGVRLWVNNRLLIDSWRDQQPGALTAEIDLPTGNIPVRVEYYENGGGAVMKLGWAWISGPTISNWRGEYYNNSYMSGSPTLVRDDAQINFNWDNGSPAGNIVADAFSARWTRSLNLSNARYRFTLTSDDGARLWVNNRLLIDQWSNHEAQTNSAEIDLPGGSVPVKVEYYEASGLAEVRLSWTQVESGSGDSDGTGGPQDGRSDNPSGMVVGVFRLNVRRGPGVSYGVITTLPGNTIVRLAGYRNAAGAWVQIDLPGGREGWVSAAYLRSSFPFANLAVWQGESAPSSDGQSDLPTAVVSNAYYLNVRGGPSTAYSVVTVASRGQRLTLAGYRNADASWVKVIMPNGVQGWVNGRYLSSSYPFTSLAVGGW